ncbi:MAG: PilW family protein [Nitrosomonadales bacterium]|nr:PilW family protein [Nitrosomonadales bacterium]
MKHIRRQSGFSIVDVMVGMLLSLIGTIVIFQVFSVSESIKRTSTNGSDAQQNGAVALFSIQRALKEAGYGLNVSDVNPVPAQITVNAASTPDSLAITYRRNWDFGPFLSASPAFASAVPPAPTVETFSINAQAQLVSSVSGAIADGIVQLKAEYGVDADGNSIVESWQTALPANPQTTVLAVRLAVVARSAQPEKPRSGNLTDACDATAAAPIWSGGSLSLAGNLALANSDSWQCYRHKTFEVTVPLRNVLWRP